LVNTIANWLDSRTGYKALLHEALEEPIPGGARWRYVFGSALTTTFLIQLVTGILLMFTYSPSASTAWGSVYYINNQMQLGWFVRGIHHFGSQAMVILVAMHLIQVLLAGAYRAPREVNWWFGMVLLFITLGFSLTGYLLPWDQKGYWATKVATNIAAGTPVLGPYIQRIVVGGSDYGNQTLTRFYGLHVGLLPALLVASLAAHIALFRKHGITPPRNPKGMGHFWPEQVFMDTIAGLAVLAILSLLVLAEGGANLDAPADPSSSDYPARPEWYFLSLFQMLKLFPGELEVVGTIIIPGAIVAVLLALPLIDHLYPKRFTHFMSCCFVFALVGGAGYLTYTAAREDAGNEQFQASRKKADAHRRRALVLAGDSGPGIPPDGPSYLLQRDPATQGRAVLEAKCLGCHAYGGQRQGVGGIPAADLKGFGTEPWIRAMLEDPDSKAYFGDLKSCDPNLAGMSNWKKKSKATPQQLDDLAAFVASLAATPPDVPPSVWEPAEKWAETAELFAKECGTCHQLGDVGENAPSLFAYGSLAWFRRMVREPAAADLYGFAKAECQMPAYAEQLSENDIAAIYRYLRGPELGNYPPPEADTSGSKPVLSGVGRE